jgi:drug/metabolite transporter (DMT)-like permease
MIISAVQALLSRTPGPFLIVAAAVLWALDGILRRSLFALPPLTIVFFESLIGTIILLPFFIRHQMQSYSGISMRTFGFASLVALLSGLLGTLWFTTALIQVGFISFSVVFLLQKLQPIFAIASAKLFLKENLPANYLKWAGLALFASFFVTFPLGQVTIGEQSAAIAAALFALGAAAAWGTSTTFSKMLLKTTTTLTATTLRFFLSTVFGLFALLYIGQAPHLETISLNNYFTLVIIALSTGMVALYLYYSGLKKTQAKISTILELTFPLLAILIDSFLYQTTLHWSQYVAAVVLMFAMYNVGKKSFPEST